MTFVIYICVKTCNLSDFGNETKSVACYESRLKKYLQVKIKQGEVYEPALQAMGIRNSQYIISNLIYLQKKFRDYVMS